MQVPIKNIPTYDYDTQKWEMTSFDTQKDFGEFLLYQCFKEPGDYQFDSDVFKWNEQATKWLQDGRYTDYGEGIPEYDKYWNNEELKCRLGVIWKKKDKVWYTTRDYYFFINFCPIINKEQGYTETFATVRDGQYHMMLYEKIAEVYHGHSVELKRRQFLYSYCHVAKSINYLWFENRKRIKWFASDEKYIDDVDGSWSILNHYKTHLNNQTDWFRNFSPDKGGEIRQREQVRFKGKWEWEGNESTVVANTLNKDPKKGVGGPTFWSWYEEGGIAPTADITLQYMEPALSSGITRVGSFCIGGSVGDLTECKPLKKFIESPNKYGFFGVPTKWYDETGIVKICGLFIPAQYGMPEATDEFGNSLVEVALKLLHKAEFEGFKAGEYGRLQDEAAWIELEPKEYILKKSQNPKNIQEAFAWRNVSEFDAVMIQRQQDIIKIQDKENGWTVKPIRCLLNRSNNGKIERQITNLPEEMVYPIDAKIVDKRGNVIIYEEPDKNAPSFTYFAGVDPVEADVTTTSESLFSISIWKKAVEIEYIENGQKKTKIEGDKIVAVWRGRFNTAEETNAQALMLIEIYKAYTLVERNKPGFINYVRRMGWGHMLAKEGELPAMLKDNVGNKIDSSQIGFYKGSQGKASEVFKEFKKYFKEYFYAEYGAIHIKDKNGDSTDIKTKVFRGIDRIPDYWFLEELKLYNDENIDNFDRIISDLAGYYIMKVYSNQMGITRVAAKTEEKPRDPMAYIYNYLNAQSGYDDSGYDYTQ